MGVTSWSRPESWLSLSLLTECWGVCPGLLCHLVEKGTRSAPGPQQRRGQTLGRRLEGSDQRGVGFQPRKWGVFAWKQCERKRLCHLSAWSTEPAHGWTPEDPSGVARGCPKDNFHTRLRGSVALGAPSGSTEGWRRPTLDWHKLSIAGLCT